MPYVTPKPIVRDATLKVITLRGMPNKYMLSSIHITDKATGIIVRTPRIADLSFI